MKITAVLVAYAVDYIAYGKIGGGKQGAGGFKASVRKKPFKGNSEILTGEAAEI